MAENKTDEINATNSTDKNIEEYEGHEQQVILRIYHISGFMVIALGTLLNVWFLSAMLSSRDIRSRLRNKIICNTLVLHLIDSAIIIPTSFGFFFSGHEFHCELFSSVDHLKLIQDFIGNWIVVMLLVVFIAQIKDFNPKLKLTRRAITIGTFGLMLLPWLASLIMVPVIVVGFHERGNMCLYPSLKANEVIQYLETVVPIIIAMILATMSVFLRYLRFRSGYTSSSMHLELISQNPEIDKSLPYTLATVVCIVCDLFMMIFFTGIETFLNVHYLVRFNIAGVAFIMSDWRAILMPLVWLLFPDIRHRVRSWRPWHRFSPGTDLTVTYTKEVEDA